VRDFDEVKKLASLATRSVSLCLAGELVEEHAQLERQLAEAKPPTSLGEKPQKLVIAKRIVEVQDRMRESTVAFHLRALPTRPWTLFLAKRPTRGEKESAESFEPREFAWQADMVSRTCTDPVMTVEQVGELVDILHHGAWVRLAAAAYVLNEGTLDVPNSEAASELIGSSEQT